VTNLDKLRIFGEALYGPRWMRATAKAIGVNYRTIQRWVSGEYEVDDAMIERMTGALERKKLRIELALISARVSPANDCRPTDPSQKIG
jgi:transposase-like protein